MLIQSHGFPINRVLTVVVSVISCLVVSTRGTICFLLDQVPEAIHARVECGGDWISTAVAPSGTAAAMRWRWQQRQGQSVTSVRVSSLLVHNPSVSSLGLLVQSCSRPGTSCCAAIELGRCGWRGLRCVRLVPATRGTYAMRRLCLFFFSSCTRICLLGMMNIRRYPTPA